MTSARVRAASAVAETTGLPAYDGSWLEVPVPFDLHRCLVRAGMLSPVEHGLAAEAAAWVENEAWWCVLDVPAQEPLGPGERCLLEFEGLDTVVEVWLDGEPLGRHANMFRPAVFDVGDRLVAGGTVHLRFASFASSGELVSLRKAQYSAGWDFAPRRPGVGVWQPAYVVRQRAAALSAVGFRTTRLESAEATVVVDLDVEVWGDGVLTADLALTSPSGEVRARTVPVVAGRSAQELVLPDPALWWTHDLGEPALHDLEVVLRVDGAPVDVAHRQVGVRTVALDRTDGAFRFVLNGEPLAVRGFNWVPCDLALGEVDPARYGSLLARVRDANAQMVRVWGGGIYEPDAFYDTCDRLGLLVWQDFMFACAEYRDDDPVFIDDVLQEARHQVRRLGSHPSLALWCGNNEVELLADVLGWASPSPAHHLFVDLLADVVATEHPGAAYVGGSPCAGNAADDGDRHAWEVWHGLHLDDTDRTESAWTIDGPALEPGSPAAQAFTAVAGAERYLEDEGRFVSEYGLAALADLATLVAWTDPAELVLGSPQVVGRQRGGRLGPPNKLALLVAAEVGEPCDLADLVDLSQLLQAEGLKTGAEHYRRQWPHCGGSLIWQLNDCWPATSWSLIDVEGRPKAAWFAARRFFAPVLASFRPTATGADLWLTNNSRTSVADELDVQLRRFDGKVVRAWTCPAAGGPGASDRLLVLDVAAGDRRSAYLTVTSRLGTVPANRQLLAPLRELERTSPTVRWSAEVVEGSLRVTLDSDSLALMTQVRGEGLVFDDDAFDLHAGRPVTVTAPLVRPIPDLVVRRR